MQLKCELLTNADYHARPELGATTLKALEREGPEYVAAMRSLPASEPDSRALAVGSAVHAVMDGTFEDSFVIAPDSYKTADSLKFAEYANEAFALSRKTALTSREWQEVRSCGESLRNRVGPHLVGRRKLHEPSLFWSQETASYRVPCKCRPDLLIDDGNSGVLYLEIKTTAATGERDWRSSSWRYGYWLQQAHYEAGILASGAAAVRTIFVVVRKSFPHDVRFYEFSADDRMNGQMRWLSLIEQYGRRCAESDWTSDDLRRPTSVALGVTFDIEIEVE
jgi:hypothetical protein